MEKAHNVGSQQLIKIKGGNQRKVMVHSWKKELISKKERRRERGKMMYKGLGEKATPSGT